MANNQNVNKVVYAGTTLIDLTGDDVTAGDVLSGKKFHLPSGAEATGTMPNIGAISGILKGDGAGNVSAATAGTDYATPAEMQAADALRAKADEVGIVITGARPSMVVSSGQYVIVRGSTITGITDGLYTAVNTLSPSTDVTAADLDSASTSHGGLNAIKSYFACSTVRLTKVANEISDVERADCFLSGNVGQITLTFTVSNTITNNTANLFSGVPRRYGFFRTALFSTDTSAIRIRLAVSDGYIQNAYTPGGIPAGQYEGTFTYILQNN